MIHLTETWTTALDFGKFVAVAFFDFRKAFDTVPHATLIMKLKLERHIGIKGSILDWLKSQLFDRKITAQTFSLCPWGNPVGPIAPVFLGDSSIKWVTQARIQDFEMGGEFL